MSNQTLAIGCAARLFTVNPTDTDALARAGQIFALVAISQALDRVADAIAPAPDDEPDPVPPGETKEGWTWP